MKKFKNRNIQTVSFLGENINFIEENKRVKERVSNLSHEKYVLEKLSKVCKPDDVFWDVGSCIGIHSFIIARQLDNGYVVDFEPMPSNRSLCIDNKSVNDLDNIWVDERALSNSDDICEFEIRESIKPGYGRHGISVDSDKYDSIHTIDVPTKKGDNIDHVPKPNIVKIDVEGASPLVLEGMEETLSRDECRHVILETHEPNPVQPSHEDFGYTVSDLIQKLESYGFTTERMENDYHIHAKKNTNPDPYNYDINHVNINIKKGDISEESSDALVNTIGTSGYLGSGVAGSLLDKSGDKLQESVLSYAPLSVGDAVTTPAFNLNAEYVIHAVSLPHHGEGKSSADSIQKSMSNALDEAEKNDCSNITVPAIGCGVGGVSITTGVREILDTVSIYEFSSVENIDIILYGENEYKTINKLISL